MTEHDIRVLVVCTGNAGRSQITEALLRHTRPDIHVTSAGVEPWADLHPMAVAVMQRRGVSMAGQYPKAAAGLTDQQFDVVVTIGTPAREQLPRSLRESNCWVHWNLADPADADGTDRSQSVFERTADDITQRLESLEQLVETRSRAAARAPWRLGISTGLWRRDFVPARHLPQIRQAGFDAIELNLFFGREHFDHHDPQAVKDLAKVAADSGIDIWSIHSPDLASLDDPDPAKRQCQLDALRACLDLADELGAHSVVSHGLLKCHKPPFDGNEVARLEQALAALIPMSHASAARIAFENGFAGARPVTDILALLSEQPHSAFGFCLDSGHANIASDFPDIARDAGPRLITLHLNDNDGRQDNHRPPGEGTVDWAALRSWLGDTRYQGCLLYELLAGPDDPDSLLRQTVAWHADWWPTSR